VPAYCAPAEREAAGRGGVKAINNKWIERKIGDDCFVGDGAHAKIPRQNAGIMYLTSKNFKSDGLNLTKIDYISEDYFKKYFKDNSKTSKRPIAEDVLFSIIPDFER
jgi:type I restriction enzyme S subunit